MPTPTTTISSTYLQQLAPALRHQRQQHQEGHDRDVLCGAHRGNVEVQVNTKGTARSNSRRPAPERTTP